MQSNPLEPTQNLFEIYLKSHDRPKLIGMYVKTTYKPIIENDAKHNKPLLRIQILYTSLYKNHSKTIQVWKIKEIANPKESC